VLLIAYSVLHFEMQAIRLGRIISMTPAFSRREFLKLSALAFGGLAFRPSLAPRILGHSVKPPEATGLVRVASDEPSVGAGHIYDQPQYPRYNEKVKVVATRKKDQLLYVYEKFESDFGPDFNPWWYRVDEGYIHTAYVQPVDTQLQDVVPYVSEQGELFEVTVPLTQSYRLTKTYGWDKLYRLYYQSTHWVTGIETGPDGAQWYRIEDELLHIQYYALASHLRKVQASELTPVSTRVAPEDKRVEVSIAEQHLWA
jgi:hypothetical protein